MALVPKPQIILTIPGELNYRLKLMLINHGMPSHAVVGISHHGGHTA